MPKERTPEEGVPLLTKVGRLTGRSRGKDISLPMPAGGKKDPRLPASLSDVHNALGEARKGLTKVRELSKRR